MTIALLYINPTLIVFSVVYFNVLCFGTTINTLRIVYSPYTILNLPVVASPEVLKRYLFNSGDEIQIPVPGSINYAGLTREPLKKAISNSPVASGRQIDLIATSGSLIFRKTIPGKLTELSVLSIPRKNASVPESIRTSKTQPSFLMAFA